MRKLSVLVFVLAVVAAFATHVNSKPALQTAYGRDNSNDCVPGTIDGTDCGSSGGTQCKVMITGVSPNPNAWQTATSCTNAFLRNP